MTRETPLVLMSRFTLLGAKSVTTLSGCTSTPATAGDGSAAWTLYSGSPGGGSSSFCCIYDILTNTYCSFYGYGHLEISLPVTPAENSACQAEILSWAQQKGATCH